mmetsp:Transcript_19842/g.36033  ORF Transcript_19842/g.36033 Transcript_19842/m.36033 type:complete len:94 (-) Transcript_19842:141-422(-)
MKKHAALLQTEVAKCHDSFMMASWDKEPNRPIPPVLVDCGTVMGLVPSTVTGAECPMVKDPEPETYGRNVNDEKRNAHDATTSRLGSHDGSRR